MTTFPTIIELPYQTDAQPYFQRLASLPNRMWLESSQTNDQDCFDILTASPLEIKRDCSLAQAELLVEKWLPADEVSEDCPFPGGTIGYYDYEARHAEFGLDAQGEARAVWAIYDWALIQDHIKKHCYVIFLSSCAESDITTRVTLLKGDTNCATEADSELFSASKFAYDMPFEHYKKSFEKIKRYIYGGDCYQINFTQRFSANFDGSTSAAFLHLRQALAGPYSCYLDFEDHQILSFSPEQFLKLHNDIAQTKPIKGTIKRGFNENDDESLAEKLLASEKDQSENLMIVDLLRNDFSKNCLPNSVKVPALFALESYKNVHHLVSTVTGVIKPGVSYATFFEGCFPGGSITGAPKKRAMEIIDELESHRRRIYCGSVVCFGKNRNLNSNIAIRTLLIENGKAYCWGGGGIVAESTLNEEYAESIQKVRVLLDALETGNTAE